MSEVEIFGECEKYLKTLCIDIYERCAGSEGNRQATKFINEQLISFGWKTEMPEFNAMDWIDGGADNSYFFPSSKGVISHDLLAFPLQSRRPKNPDFRNFKGISMNADITPLIVGILVFISSLISLKLALSVAIIEILLGAFSGNLGLH